VRLLGRFLAAGADWPLAVETANALMLNAGADEMFSTMDLLLLDLSGGLAEFVKLAACPALVARDGALERIEGGRLPLGILAEAEPQVTVLALRPGDVLMMGTDGALEGLDPETAQQCLIRHRQAEEKYLAREIIRLGRQKRVHADDMTLAVIGIARAQDGGTDMASGG
jgi:stage II sporulation protein E